LAPTNSFLLLGVITSVPILVKIDQEMQPGECAQTDIQMHAQTQTGFVICLMLYAIAVVQIKRHCLHGLVQILKYTSAITVSVQHTSVTAQSAPLFLLKHF